MISRTTARFRAAFADLPEDIQQHARSAYRQFFRDPTHPSLRWKRVHPTRPIYSVRVSRVYRAVGVREAETIVWFWIGSHAEYDQVLARL